MSVNPIAKTIKQAKFIEGMVNSGGNITAAYKEVSRAVTHGSAGTLGSRMLKEVGKDDTQALLVQIGCTKEAVLTGLWERMKKTRKDSDYIKGTSVIAKIAGWEGKENQLRDLMDSGLDLVEIVKVRLRKSTDSNELSKPIDIVSTSSNDLDKAQ